MKVEHVGARIKRVVNTGDYNSAHLEAWAEGVVEDGEEPAEAMREAMALCRAQLAETAGALLGNRAQLAEIQEYFAGSPVRDNGAGR